jgi:signal transduction histidine kinase
LDRLEVAFDAQRRFMADASHQLRTPLQALRLELEAIELRDGAPPELPAALAQVDRLQTTIETLLAVARDAPRTTTSTDLGRLVDDARERWHGPLAADGRPLRIRMDRSEQVRAAPHVVGEVLDVLLDNARRHGGGEVTLAARGLDGYVAIEVSDEGPGFPGDPEEAFGRRTGAREGHGIGLALARSLAHAEGGRLSASHAGPRPTLSLVLPRAGASSATR